MSGSADSQPNATGSRRYHHHVSRREPALIAAASSRTAVGSWCGTLSGAELMAGRVIARYVTRPETGGGVRDPASLAATRSWRGSLLSPGGEGLGAALRVRRRGRKPLWAVPPEDLPHATSAHGTLSMAATPLRPDGADGPTVANAV